MALAKPFLMAISKGMLLKVNKQETATLPMLAASPDTEVGLSHPHARLTRGWAAAIAAIGLAFAVLVGAAGQAHAASSPCPDHSVTAAFMVEGTLLNGDTPIKGAKVTVTGPGFTTCGLSDDTGHFIIDEPKAGKYVATLDLTTLPKGASISKADATQQVDLTNTNDQSVLFTIGVQASTATSIWSQVAMQAFEGLNFGLMLALCAIGVSMIFGTTGFSNFAHGETVTLAALTTWFFSVVLGWNILVAAVITIALTVGYGWLQDAAIWKPLRKRRLGLNQTMIVSIGFSMAIRYVLLIVFGGDTKDLGGESLSVQLGPINTNVLEILSMVISALALVGVALFLTKTRVGKATRAVSDNPSLAAATGIDVERIIRYVWLLASGLTGLAGILFGLQYQANYQTGFTILLLMFAAATLGGLGTSLGTAIGALIIGLVVQMSSLVIPTDLTYASALVILILTLLVRPQGILGKKQRLG